MKIKIACGSCDHEFAVSDQLLGKRVKCPSCGEAVRVAEPDDLDVGESQRNSKPGKKSKKKKHSGTGLLIGLGIGGGILALATVTGVFLFAMSGSRGSPATVVTTPPGQRGKPPATNKAINVATRKAEMAQKREEIHLQLSDLYERMLNLLKEVPDGETSIKRQKEFERLFDEEYKLEVRLADAGGDRPSALTKGRVGKLFDAVHSRLYGNGPGMALPIVGYRWHHSTTHSKPDPYNIQASVRAWGRDCVVEVKFVNGLSGSQRSAMIAALKDQLGAEKHAVPGRMITEIFTDSVAFAPVADFEQALKSVTLGTISEIDLEHRKFTLTVAPEAVPRTEESMAATQPPATSEEPAPAPEPEPPPTPKPATEESPLIAARNAFKGFPDFKKPGSQMLVQFDGYTGTTPMKATIERIVKGYSPADFGSLQIDEPTMQFRFQVKGNAEVPPIGNPLYKAGFQGLRITPPKNDAD